MKIEISLNYAIDIESSKLNGIIEMFKKLIPQIVKDIFQLIVTAFGEHYMSGNIKPYECKKCKNRERFIWKSRHGKKTGILTELGKLEVNQLQVKCKECGRKLYITREILGIEPRVRIPYNTRLKLGLIGSLTTFRVAEKMTKIFGWTVDKMTIWRSVKKVGEDIKFGIDINELPEGEADGTGIPIQGIGKRGKEMKVFVQHKKDGKVRIAGISIGNYDKGWDKLFKPLIKNMNKFKTFLIVTDGDTSIFDGIKSKVKIVLQRCLWHIPHQLKYTLWKDKVKRKSEKWLYILSEIYQICSIRSLLKEDDIIDTIIKSKEEKLDKLIKYCDINGFKSSSVYLSNAKPDMFNALKNRFAGKTTSRVERVMKTINMRINVGKWSDKGSLNATKIRLAYYYNDFDV